jgi:hypothetical protein
MAIVQRNKDKQNRLLTQIIYTNLNNITHLTIQIMHILITPLNGLHYKVTTNRIKYMRIFPFSSVVSFDDRSTVIG